MKKEIKIGIAEDHPLLRLGLVSALKSQKNIKIQFDVANGKELLDELKAKRPDIILLDIEMPIMRAQDVLGRIKVKYPRIKVIIISAFFQRSYIQECFRLGVKAFLRKGDPIETTLEVINTVHEKGIFLDAEVSKILTEDYENLSKKTTNLNLTVKEMEVLSLISQGLSRKSTAENLDVAIDTVNYHMRNIFRKTNTDNVSSLIAYSIKNNLVNLKQ